MTSDHPFPVFDHFMVVNVMVSSFMMATKRGFDSHVALNHAWYRWLRLDGSGSVLIVQL